MNFREMDLLRDKLNGPEIPRRSIKRINMGKSYIRFTNVRILRQRSMMFLYFDLTYIGSVDINTIEMCSINGNTFFIS